MSSNYWNQQQGNAPDPRQHSPSMNGNGNGNGASRSASLLSNYNGQQLMPGPQGWPTPQGPSSLSPIPPSSSQFLPPQSPQQFPQFPQGQPQMPQGAQYPQNWSAQQGGQPGPVSVFASAMNTMRRWSGKMAAARGGYIDPNPLVLRRPPVTPPVKRRARWKRSHAVRVAMQMRHRRTRWQRNRPNTKKILTISFSIFAALIVVLLASGFGAAYAYYQSEYPHVQELANQQVNQSTRIYDRNFKLIYTAYDGVYGRGTAISYYQVPGVMQDAMTATEDHTFWDNSGIDPQGILRAATEYFSNGGVVSGGGSTITQQVVKNLTGDNQVSLQRKIPEAALAIGLTQQYAKWKILEMYFNVAPFGAQELGVDAAAEDYFGLRPQCDANFKCIPAISFLDRDLTKCTKASDLSTCKEDPILGLARASLLAGMPQNPPGYDPTVSSANILAAQARQDYVLNQMLSLNMNINIGLGDQKVDSGLGPITPAMIAQVEALTKTFKYPGFKAIKTDPHFVDWIIPIIENALGNGDPQLGAHLFLTGGFNIRTTIDSNLETFIENDVRHQLRDPIYQIFVNDYGPLNQVHNVNNSAVVVENAKTGEILAMDGSADYNSTDPRIAGQVNSATALRPPGSSFKPIVYSTAFQMGWYPGIVLPDKETFFPGGSQTQDVHLPTATYHPSDYGGTATQGYWHNLNSNALLAIANSFNVPAIKALEYAGFGNVLNMARRFGITDLDTDTVNYVNEYNKEHHTHINLTTLQNLGPSFALGSYDVSLLQMVGAYQVFADQGNRVPQQYVLDIWDNYGHHIYQFDPNHPQTTRVISQQIAFMMSSMLSDNQARALEFAPDTVLTTQDWDGRPVAAKTGTTDGFQDNWTMGYTPDIVVGVWSGNANGDLMKDVVGITGAAPIWHDALEYASGRCFPAESFPGNWTSCGDLKFPPDAFNPPQQGVTQQEVNT
ncbi:MAG TPA: transglycosylase domain-containing protein, partial [Ktedonobacteraceae bacterium]